MKINEGILDRVIRVVVGAALLYLGTGTTMLAGFSLLGNILGAILLLTGIIGFCPLYYAFKLSTNK